MSKKRAVVQAAESRYWRETDARVVVEAWRESGESLAGFCRAYGLSRARVARWAKLLDEGARPVHFEAIEVATSTAAPKRLLEVELPGVATVRVPPGFALEDLRRVLDALTIDEAC